MYIKDGQILPPDAAAAQRSHARWEAIAKPLGSLGRLESAVVKISALTGNEGAGIDRRALLIFCADNGVVAQGISQAEADVTLRVAQNMAAGKASVCHMAQVAQVDLSVVDMGMKNRPQHPGIRDQRIAPGTRDFCRFPAMTRQQAHHAIQTGIRLACEKKKEGYSLLMAGEMGIGNTTSSAAVLSVLLGKAPQDVTGKGAGLSDAGWQRKVAVIEQAIARHAPRPADPLGVLSAVGGFDIAAMTGLYLGAAMQRIPVLLDGIISLAAALLAVQCHPRSSVAMLASHLSAEPAAAMALQRLGLEPLICCDMYLGEGSGAVAAVPLLDMAYAVYREMDSFEEVNITPYARHEHAQHESGATE